MKAPLSFKITRIGDLIAERGTLRAALRTGKRAAKKLGHDVIVAHSSSGVSWTVNPFGSVNLNQ